MKKMKVTIMTLAILLSIGGAFATRLSDPPCYGTIQYHKVGNSYNQCGTIGVNFDCVQSADVCTYWLNPSTNQYEACHQGTWAFIPALTVKNNK